MQPSVPNGLLRSDLDGKGLLPQVTQASHSELSEADQYRGGQGGAMNIFVYRQGTTNCLVSHKTIMAIHNKGYMAPQQNLWVAEVGLRQMIRSVLSG